MKENDTHQDLGLRLAVQRQVGTAEKATLTDDFTDRLMQRIEGSRPAAQQASANTRQRKARTQRHHWRWAAAACLLVLVGVGAALLSLHRETPPPVAAALPAQEPVAEPQGRPLVAATDTTTSHARPVRKKKAGTTARPKAHELPDTLGNGIWQRRENVLLALQLLAECEADGEQRQRNAVVEAAFRATPRPPELQLVVSETGDYMVVADDQHPVIIEL